MASSPPTVDIRRPPREFDELIEWFERLSYRLVLLEEYPLDDLRAMVRTVGSAVSTHCRIEDPLLARLPLRSSDEQTLARVLAADHVWFRTSTEQLEWFLSIVVGEDHGGHRQALGQYGRIFAESLRRHRSDERRLARTAAAETFGARGASGSGNGN
jgi:hypothetical protein